MQDKGLEYDVAVIGAGLMGSSAAYHASAAGKRVLLVEQFSLLHSSGSSHGSSRIFRVAYTNGVYTKMCIDSLGMWREIEKTTNTDLLEMTGELDFVERPHCAQLDEVASVLSSFNIPHDVLNGSQVNAKFPGFSLPADSRAVYNPNAGILNPTLAMQTFQELSLRQGAEIRDNCRVVSVHQDGDLIAVALADGSVVHVEQCILTAGPWTKKLLGEESVAIRPIATFGTYWKCDPTKEELHTPSRLPVFINYEDPWIYGLPMQDPKDGVKVCMHGGPAVDPDTRHEIISQPDEDLAKVQQFLKSYMPHVDASKTSKVDLCMYSMTSDEDFILDFVDAPRAESSSSSSDHVTKQLVVGAGFSGHGAKMTPVIGKILADLAIHGKTSYPIDQFARDRFTK